MTRRDGTFLAAERKHLPWLPQPIGLNGDLYPGPEDTLHEQAYRAIRHALIVGRLAPGKGVSLRSLAEATGLGISPVRAAIYRLSAEKALAVHENRRVSIPEMTMQRFDELMQARMALEPICAARALYIIDKARLARIARYDDLMNGSYESGDAEVYMSMNYCFHFEIYKASGSPVIVPLLESIWMQFGPFMRKVYGMVGTAQLIDKHQLAISAIRRKDENALKAAIEADILDGMDLLGRSIFARGENVGPPAL